MALASCVPSLKATGPMSSGRVGWWGRRSNGLAPTTLMHRCIDRSVEVDEKTLRRRAYLKGLRGLLRVVVRRC